VIFRPFYYFDTGCAAYVFGCAGKGYAAVVDPQSRDLESYHDFATAKGMRITHVIDTHVHADHISGGRALAEKAGAVYALHESAPIAFPFFALRDGQEIGLGNVTVKVLHTPGHTPESICLLVTDTTRGPEPWFLLTGDTLFVGSVGRPDLSDQIEQSAKNLYRSLQRHILPLPDTLEVYPGHFSGSVCGKGMSGKPMSSLGFEKRFNPLLSATSEEFVNAITQTVLPEPLQKAEILRRNQGRDIRDGALSVR
jgi:glyoxylase-like metal-dependent hydrolase (beta-lactamase superfamily II)